MNDEKLTDELARRVMGWKAGSDRFIKSARAWTPRWRFAPLTNLEHALVLLDHAASTYTLATEDGGAFTAEVQIGTGRGAAAGEEMARTIGLAVADALGLEVGR